MANEDRRSDDHIRDSVRQVLEQPPYADASDIELQVEEGVVVLSGTVREGRLRKRVEEAVQDLPGVRDVENQIRVIPGRLDEALNDLSATGTPSGRGTTGAAGSIPPPGGPRGRNR